MNSEKRLQRAKQKQKENRARNIKNPSGVGLSGGFRTVDKAVKSQLYMVNKDYKNMIDEMSKGGVAGTLARAKYKKVDEQLNEIIEKIKDGESIENITKEIESKTGYKLAKFLNNVISKVKK